DLSSEMIMPILPMFIESLGGGKLAVGILGGIRDSLSSLVNVVSGYLAGRTGRKKIFVFAGYFTSAFFKLLLALSTTFKQAVVVSSLERLGKGLRNAPRDAIIAESMPLQRGTGFGIHRALDTLGAIFGSLLVFVLMWLFNFGFKSILIIASLLSLVCLIPLVFVKETRSACGGPKEKGAASAFGVLPAGLKVFLAIAAGFALGNFSYMFFVLRAGQFFADKWSKVLPVGLYVLFNIFCAGFVMPLGVLADRIGKRKVIIFGYLLFAATCFGFVFVRSAAGLVALFIFYGISVAAVDGNQRAIVSDLAGGQVKAAALGAYHTAVGLMALPAGLIAGLLWKYISAATTFIYGGSIGLVCAVMLIAFGGYIEKRK
ncbi:MAG: MFS transporter, partial [bacterium]|nr:MFS transporter [bacterium]